MHQSIANEFGLAQKLIPVVRRVTALEHLAKDAVGVITAVVCALGVVIIHPGINDHIGAFRKRRARRTVSGTLVGTNALSMVWSWLICPVCQPADSSLSLGLKPAL